MIVRFNFNSDMTKLSADTNRYGLSPTMNIGALSYPDEWLRKVGYTDFPLPPIETQCPPLCPGSSLQLGAQAASDQPGSQSEFGSGWIFCLAFAAGAVAFS